MRGFDVAPYVAAAARKGQAKLQRQAVYNSSAARQDKTAAHLPITAAAPPCTESAANLSSKEKKAALKKLNKERKKAPVIFDGAVYRAHGNCKHQISQQRWLRQQLTTSSFLVCSSLLLQTPPSRRCH